MSDFNYSFFPCRISLSRLSVHQCNFVLVSVCKRPRFIRICLFVVVYFVCLFFPLEIMHKIRPYFLSKYVSSRLLDPTTIFFRSSNKKIFLSRNVDFNEFFRSGNRGTFLLQIVIDIYQVPKLFPT